MMHLRLWLFVCMGWCILWIPSAQASWEFYQQAGEEAYSRGDYATARQMFLAAVREARELGLQDPRLDISLHHLALLRGERSAPSQAEGSARRMTGQTAPARKHSQVHRGHRRRPARPEVRRGKTGRRHQAPPSVRRAERRKGTQATPTRREQRGKPPRDTLQRSRAAPHAAPPGRQGKRREAIQTPRRQGGDTQQQSRAASRPPKTTAGKRSPTRSR